MKPMMIITGKKQHQAFIAGQAGRTSNDIADQLIEQLRLLQNFNKRAQSILPR